MIGAYTETQHFAYPGWRLTVPGGPAGGHYKGFTHTQAAGTDIPPGDSYEQDREDGMSSHDAVHASPRNPRGVYRSSAEVPPRPNASGAAMTYRGMQTKRHPGTSVAPGAFPAPFEETDEDAFLRRYDAHQLGVAAFDDGLRSELVYRGDPIFRGPGPMPFLHDDPTLRPNTVCSPGDTTMADAYWDAANCRWVPRHEILPISVTVPRAGPTSVVNQPPASPLPLPPSPIVAEHTAPPISPRPAPVVYTHEVQPDGGGGYYDVSSGASVPASSVSQNPATGQLTASKAFSWLEEKTIFSALPNWGVVAGGLLLASMFMGGKRR